VTVNANGATGNINVSARSQCSWTAASNTEWIKIVSGASGTADGLVAYTVEQNTTIQPRTGTLTIADKTVTIEQSAPNLSGRWGLTATGFLQSLEFNVRVTTITRVRFAYQFTLPGGRICDRVIAEDLSVPMTDGQFTLPFQSGGMSTTLTVGFVSAFQASGTLAPQTFSNTSCGPGSITGVSGGGDVVFGRID
jgi:hypothetical protein